MQQERTNLAVDWGDVDSLGHVNNLALMRYVQAARVHYFESVGLPVGAGQAEGPILAHIACRFCTPLFYPDTVEVHTHAKHLGTTSLVLAHSLYNGQGQCVAQAEDVLVYFAYAQNEKRPWPQHLRDAIQQKGVG